MAIEELNDSGGGIFLRSNDANGENWEVERGGRHTITIHADSVYCIELGREAVKELLPYLQGFVNDGTLESRRGRR